MKRVTDAYVRDTKAKSGEERNSKGGSKTPPAYGLSFIDSRNPMQFVSSVIQMVRPIARGYYNIQGKPKPLYYKGEPEVDRRYKFYVNPEKKMSQFIPEASIEGMVETSELQAPSESTSAPGKQVNVTDNVTEHTIERRNEKQRDEILSGRFDERLSENSPGYQWKTRQESKARKIIERLRAQTAHLRAGMPDTHTEVWRFHSSPKDYQSHAYQEAQKNKKEVPDDVLSNAVANDDAISSHMYESSAKHQSPGISYTRSLDSILDASFHVGSDSVLKKVIHGGGEKLPALLLSYAQIPKDQLMIPEKVPVPKDAERRDRKGEARMRSLNEMEALHIPRPGSGGRAFGPLMTFDNPFARRDVQKRAAAKAVLQNRPKGMTWVQLYNKNHQHADILNAMGFNLVKMQAMDREEAEGGYYRDPWNFTPPGGMFEMEL